MPKFESDTVAFLFYALGIVAGVALLWLGYQVGQWLQKRRAGRLLAEKDQDLFTAQKSFKNLYEQEMEKLKQENADLLERLKAMESRVEAYRKKAAGLGGLFSTHSKRADAMYALLLENEALEETLLRQNDKLAQERADAVQEQIRSTGYRRVLISQLLNDDRVKDVVSEMLQDDKRLPSAEEPKVRELPSNRE